jgi:hypothetical protein
VSVGLNWIFHSSPLFRHQTFFFLPACSAALIGVAVHPGDFDWHLFSKNVGPFTV